jgi:hypothetical protein
MASGDRRDAINFVIERRATMKQEQAISATVTGNDQQVGFRAMVMKQAIQYNSREPRRMKKTKLCGLPFKATQSG